eukprot:jgi/Orpsp1_1/1182405/evm.model.c7180000081153.1
MNVINSTGNIPLTLAYRLNFKAIFRYLLCYLDINEKDSKGNNIMYYAIESEDIETIHYLIRNKIDVNSKNAYGVSCLDYAITKGSSILNIFLSYAYDNIQYNIPNADGETPLITVIRAKNYISKEKENIVDHLLAKGSNVNFVDRHGNSALYYAIKKKLTSVAKLLIRHGANINFLSDSKYKSMLKYAPEMEGELTKYLLSFHSNTNNGHQSLKNSHNLRRDIDMDISESHTNNDSGNKINFDMMEYL